MTKKRIVMILVALLVAFGMMPMTGGTAYAAESHDVHVAVYDDVTGEPVTEGITWFIQVAAGSGSWDTTWSPQSVRSVEEGVDYRLYATVDSGPTYIPKGWKEGSPDAGEFVAGASGIVNGTMGSSDVYYYYIVSSPAEPITIQNECEADGITPIVQNVNGEDVTAAPAGSVVMISIGGGQQLDPDDPNYNEGSQGGAEARDKYLIVTSLADGSEIFNAAIGFNEQNAIMVPAGGIKIRITYDNSEQVISTPLDQTITASNKTKTYGNAAFSLGAATNGDGVLTYTSSNTKVVTVSSAGKVTIKGAGTAKITIRASGTENYKEAEKTITVKVNRAANPLKVGARTASIKYSNLKKKTQTLAVSKTIRFTKKVSDKKNYALSSVKKGSKSFKKYFTISKTTGKVTIKKNSKMKKGTYKVKIKVKALGNTNYAPSAWKSVTFTVKVK